MTKLFTVCFMIALSFLTLSAQAQTVDWQQKEPLLLTPAKAEILRLPMEAGAVIVGNPDYISAILDSPQLLVLVPQREGATSLTVLDQRGNTIVNRDILISANSLGHVKITRGCRAGEDCQAPEILRCFGKCITISASEGGTSPSGAASQISSGYDASIPADEAGFADPNAIAE